MWFDIEDFGLGFAEVFPEFEAIFRFLSGCGWYLNIDRCFVVFNAIFNERFFKLAHDGQKFARANEGEGSGHGGSVGGINLAGFTAVLG
jgi:hypothetical protein